MGALPNSCVVVTFVSVVRVRMNGGTLCRSRRQKLLYCVWPQILCLWVQFPALYLSNCLCVCVALSLCLSLCLSLSLCLCVCLSVRRSVPASPRPHENGCSHCCFDITVFVSVIVQERQVPPSQTQDIRVTSPAKFTEVTCQSRRQCLFVCSSVCLSHWSLLSNCSTKPLSHLPLS